MKGCNARSMNYSNIGVDDCVTPSTSEGLTLDDDSCNFLDMELSNAKFERVRKLMNKGKEIISSKCMIDKNMNMSFYKGFKTKWVEKRKKL